MKMAAIWARVSTQDQRELSLEGQVERCRTKLEGLGYLVPPERILAVDWTSMNLYACPQFQELRRWVKTKEIGALGVLDRDRLAAQGLQRLNFLADCKEAGVELIPYQGPPMLEGPEGQLVELALAIGKERSVERAQQGARDGLRDRAKLKGLPTTCGNPYGYRFDDTRKRLLPTGGWDNAALVWQLALSGTSLKGIRRELHSRGILSPKGREWWPESTIYYVLSNPVCCGEYRALRWERVFPESRQGNTYGKSSRKRLPGMRLPIEVMNPIVTKEQFEYVQVRLEQNRMNSRRNTRRNYLLRGMVFYEGDNRRYHGHIRDNCWCYRYSIRGGCRDNPLPSVPGRQLEERVWELAIQLLTGDVLEREMGWREAALKETANRLGAGLARLAKKAEASAGAESELVGLRIRHKVSDGAYERNLALLRAERRWIDEERERIKTELATLRSRSLSLVGLDQLRKEVALRLASGSAEDRRFVLEALGLKVAVTTEGKIEVEFNIPTEPVKDVIAFNTPRY